MTLIFINPGHSKNGQPDVGCAYNGSKEYDLAAKIANKLSELLAVNDFATMVYQQTGCGNDSNKQLNSVCSTANVSKADLFLSIHMNGFANTTAKGTETIYLKGSAKGKKFAELINTELTKPFSNYTLANRGAKVDVRGLAVLKYTNMPAALTEIGFISNVAENEFIKSNINEIATRLCKAICAFYGKSYKTTNDGILSISGTNKEFRLIPTTGGKYNCYVNDELKLKGNKLVTCLDWIVKNYQV